MTGNIAGTRHFLRGSLWSATSVLWTTVALLAVGKMATNALPREAVGLFSLVLICSDFMNMLFSGGLWITMPKLVAGASDDERPPLIGSVILWQLWIVFGSAVLGLCVWFLACNGMLDVIPDPWRTVAQSFWAVTLLFSLGIFRDLLLAILAGLDRYASRATAMALTSLVQVALVYLAVWNFGGGVSMLILCLVAGYGVGVSICAAIVIHKASLKVGTQRGWNTIRFTAPLYANSLLVFLYQRTDTLLIGGLIGLGPAAVLEMVKRLPMVMTRVLGAGLTPYLPHLTRLVSADDKSGAAQLAERTARITAFMGYGAALTAIVFREPIIRLLFSSEYLSGTGTLVLLLTSAVIALQTGVMGQTLIALGQNMAVTIINLSLVAVGLAMNFCLLPFLGMVGAGWASVMAISISGILQAAWVRRSGIPVHWQAILFPHAAFALACLPSLLADSIALRLLSIVLFVTLSLSLGVVTSREIRQSAEALRANNGNATES